MANVILKPNYEQLSCIKNLTYTSQVLHASKHSWFTSTGHVSVGLRLALHCDCYLAFNAAKANKYLIKRHLICVFHLKKKSNFRDLKLLKLALGKSFIDQPIDTSACVLSS